MKRLTFVLQLGQDTEPSHRRYEGRIEEVDSGRELRFRSIEELLAFLGECFESSRQRAREASGDDDTGTGETD